MVCSQSLFTVITATRMPFALTPPEHLICQLSSFEQRPFGSGATHCQHIAFHWASESGMRPACHSLYSLPISVWGTVLYCKGRPHGKGTRSAIEYVALTPYSAFVVLVAMLFGECLFNFSSLVIIGRPASDISLLDGTRHVYVDEKGGK